jgi:alkaline phosphatase D
MSSLRPAQLGPIVGHSSDTTARLWIRGGPIDKGAAVDQHRRTMGVIAITKENGRSPRSRLVHYFRLRREYDRTGTFTLGEEVGIKPRVKEPRPLSPGSEYVVRVGTLSIDDPNPDDESIPNDTLASRLPDPNVWYQELEDLDPERSEARFTTFPAADGSGDSNLSFILGSCRYPGLLWKAKQSDAIFGPLLEEAQGRDGRDPARFALMVGDQIYADMLNRHIPVGLADTFEEFQERYHSAFGSRCMRKLLRHLPTYMILDDHEIEDNWSQDRILKAEHRRVFNLAIDSYRSYQWVHGPTCYGMRLYYYFQCGGYPFFVLDLRTQRFMDDVEDQLEDNHLLGRPSLDSEEPSQLDLLLAWLQKSQDNYGDRPKFIGCSSVFVPNPMGARTGRTGSPHQKVKWAQASDSWPGFPATRTAILRHIVKHSIQNVVFLSGDIHCANVAAMRFTGSKNAKKLKAFSITSSAFYWPFPFADGEPSNFVHDSTAPGQEDGFEFDVDGSKHEMNYRAWNFTQDDNFCRVDLNRADARIVVTPFGSNGDVIEKGGWFGVGGTPIESELELAKW